MKNRVDFTKRPAACNGFFKRHTFWWGSFAAAQDKGYFSTHLYA